MEEKKIARENRNEEKLSHGDWVMAEFYATWCPHCKRMHPVVKEFKKMMEGILEVVEVDVDQKRRTVALINDDNHSLTLNNF